MNNWLARTELLIGQEALNKLQSSCVAIFGCGGVGSYVTEGLIRAGVGSLVVIDNDTIDITNINRQLIADTTTIGKPKVELVRDRALKINPNLNLTTYQEFADISNFDTIIPSNCNYIVDAIDTVKSKIDLAVYSTSKNIPIISSMGTGNKLNPCLFEITDIYKTQVCPLAKVMRKELKNRGVKHLKVLYSKEEPLKSGIIGENGKAIPGSISFVPSVAGLIIAGEVIKDLL